MVAGWYRRRRRGSTHVLLGADAAFLHYRDVLTGHGPVAHVLLGVHLVVVLWLLRLGHHGLRRLLVLRYCWWLLLLLLLL